VTRYLNLAEYFVLAELVTGVPAETLTKASRVDLADSALHAPQAGFGEEDFYPGLFDKAAVLCWRLARNHPLPDGNKRAAWISKTYSSNSTAVNGNLLLPMLTSRPRILQQSLTIVDRWSQAGL